VGKEKENNKQEARRRSFLGEKKGLSASPDVLH
jgi:hypothetical protein